MTEDHDRIAQHLQEVIWEDHSENADNECLNPKSFGKVEHADSRVRITGPCGDPIEMWPAIEGGKISDERFTTDGCRATITCASYVTEAAKGRTFEEALTMPPQGVVEYFGGLSDEHEHRAKPAVMTLTAPFRGLPHTTGVLVFTLLLIDCIFGSAGAAALRGGFAKVNITPAPGIPLIGSYGKPSEDILDELYVRAMVLGDSNTTVAIVSADLLYTPLEEIAGPVRRIIRDKTGLPEQNILVCATHTHSGPEVFTRSKLRPDQEVAAAKIDQAYLQVLIGKMAASAVIAQKNMQAVRIGAARGSAAEMVFNRRPTTAEGKAVMTWSVSAETAATRRIETCADGSTRVSFSLDTNKPALTFGPVDPELCVLRVEDANGGIVGSIINFACHPVCVYPSMPTTISADYPGDVTDLVERTEGGICLFTLGAAGDIVPYQRGLKAHRQLGRALGAEAVRRLQFVATSDAVVLKAARKAVKFPTKQQPSDEADKEPAGTTGHVETEMQVLRLGDIYILALPGEVLVEVGLEIKKRAGIEKLFIVSLGNDVIGYVCHAQAYEQGGYEPGAGTHLAKGAGEIMMEEALELIERAKGE